MIEQLYLDLAEEKNDTKICGKLFQVGKYLKILSQRKCDSY